MGYKVPVLDYYEWQKAVLDKDLTFPPEPEFANKGDRYIIGYNPSGAWYNRPKRIAEWNGTSWDIVEPKEGMLTLVQDEGVLYHYINNKWRNFALLTVKRYVESNPSGRQLTLDDAGKVFTCDTTSDCTFILPSVTGSDIGTQFTFIRIGGNINKLTIQANDNDYIAESSPGGNIYCNSAEQRLTTLSILLATYNQWVIMAGQGTWIAS